MTTADVPIPSTVYIVPQLLASISNLAIFAQIDKIISSDPKAEVRRDGKTIAYVTMFDEDPNIESIGKNRKCLFSS